MGFRVPDIGELKFVEAMSPTLVLEAWASSSFNLLLRGCHKYGTFDLPLTTTADRAINIATIRIPALPVSLNLGTVDVVRKGQCYCKVGIRLAGMGIIHLISDYLDSGQNLSWPHSHLRSNVGEQGYLRSVAGTNPAAGNEVSETVPTNARWRLKSLIATLVTDATVVTRVVRIVIDDGTNMLWRGSAAFDQTASWDIYYVFADHTFRGDDNQGQIHMPLPRDLLLFQGWRVRTVTANLQAGDNWAAPQLLVEEWIEE